MKSSRSYSEHRICRALKLPAFVACLCFAIILDVFSCLSTPIVKAETFIDDSYPKAVVDCIRYKDKIEVKIGVYDTVYTYTYSYKSPDDFYKWSYGDKFVHCSTDYIISLFSAWKSIVYNLYLSDLKLIPAENRENFVLRFHLLMSDFEDMYDSIFENVNQSWASVENKSMSNKIKKMFIELKNSRLIFDKFEDEYDQIVKGLLPDDKKNRVIKIDDMKDNKVIDRTEED